MPTGSKVILQTYSWHLDLGAKDPDATIGTLRDLASKLIRIRPMMRGMKLDMADSNRLHIQIRVAGHTRWEIQRDARKLITMFLRRIFVMPTQLELELVTTETNGRQLYLGEGRTPMVKRSRAPRQDDGRPWDHYEWWGDELPTADPDTEAERRDAHEVAPWFQGPATVVDPSADPSARTKATALEPEAP